MDAGIDTLKKDIEKKLENALSKEDLAKAMEDFSLENLKGKTDPEVIRQELSVLPLNIDELKDYPVYVLDWQSRECSGAELLDEFYEQTSENQPAQLVIVHHLVSEELVTARCISIP